MKSIGRQSLCYPKYTLPSAEWLQQTTEGITASISCLFSMPSWTRKKQKVFWEEQNILCRNLHFKLLPSYELCSRNIELHTSKDIMCSYSKYKQYKEITLDLLFNNHFSE